ncbi:MAG: family 43 glycosylhydrolase [Muribaculaceae bacterium]|nr:family 43 glycosylhydrolase [Muribaculaceae bacterium]
MKKFITALLCSVMFCTISVAQHPGYFTNPVIRGDMADPSVIHIDDTYYATGTSSEWAPFYPVYKSRDLVNWQLTGHIFDRQPEWTKSSFWAPELFYHNGKVYVYYTARNKSNVSYIGVAVADLPTGEFTDYGPVVEHGTEAIDAFVLEDDGLLYISWKAYDLDERPIELLACRLTPDGLRLDGEPFSLLRDDENIGMEGQQWLWHNGYYYIIYAIKNCCGPGSDYAVSVARSKNLMGPYEKYNANPILHGGDEIQSIGHGTLTTTPDGRYYYLCHAYTAGSDINLGRRPHLQEMRFGEDGWPHFVTGESARLVQPMPFDDCIQQPVADFHDDFSASELRPEWSWNYPYADVMATLESGRLSLTGSSEREGRALCLQPAHADYLLTAGVSNQNGSFKGLTLYGDDGNYLAYGCVGERLQLRLVRDGNEQLLADILLPSSSLHLAMRVSDGLPSQFMWSNDGHKWITLDHAMSHCALPSLARWDRIARPGLYHAGVPTAPARLENRSLSYR